RRQRRALARAGGPGDEDQAARLLGQLADDGRQSKLLKSKDFEGDRAERRGDRAALHEEVGAEARQALHAEAQVELVLFLELVLLRVGKNRIAKLLRLHRGERRSLQRNERAIDAELRRRAGGDVEVARPLLHHRLQELMQVRHFTSSYQALCFRPLLRCWSYRP